MLRWETSFVSEHWIVCDRERRFEPYVRDYLRDAIHHRNLVVGVRTGIEPAELGGHFKSGHLWTVQNLPNRQRLETSIRVRSRSMTLGSNRTRAWVQRRAPPIVWRRASAF
jgi:hypothetical protein